MKILDRFYTFMSGLLNGLFGAGGGIVTVSVMKGKGLGQKEAQATALCATFIMSVISCVFYSFMGYFKITDALVYIPFGIPGSVLGSFLLSKIPDKVLRKLFAVFILWAGVRMIL